MGELINYAIIFMCVSQLCIVLLFARNDIVKAFSGKQKWRAARENRVKKMDALGELLFDSYVLNYKTSNRCLTGRKDDLIDIKKCEDFDRYRFYLMRINKSNWVAVDLKTISSWLDGKSIIKINK